MPTRLRIFITLLTAAAFGLFVLLAMSGKYFFDWQSLVFFSALVFLAENFCIDLPKAGAVSVTFTILLAGIILFGPALPAIASMFGAIIWRDIKKGTHPYRWVFNGAQYAVTTALAGFTYVAAGGPVLTSLSRGFTVNDFPSVLFPLMLAIVVFFLTNTSLVSTIIGLAEGMQPLSVWLVNVRWAIPNYFALAPLGLAMAQIFMATGGIGVILMIVPLIVARQTFQVYMRLRNAYLGTVQSLIAALEAKDPYTRGHSERVSRLANKIGRQLKLSEEDLETLHYAGILHDIGKVGTARYILRKPGKLTEDEYQRIRLHPESGALILREIRFLSKAIPAIFHHHEHFDGTGYIDGIKGEEIPLPARILTVADAYDAMTSPRPYRSAMPIDIACRELISCSGSQFDPAVVAAFLQSIGYHEKSSEIPEGQLHFDETTA
ncbi:MAG: HD-GYP domain-containing protein [Actinomycetota bacterium]|nr:HD-GYP domain-containing protein [Actinomycetota bacterium]